MMKNDTTKGTANGTAKKTVAKKPALAKRLQPSAEDRNKITVLRSVLNYCGYTCRKLEFDTDLSIHGQVETGNKDSINFRSEKIEHVIEDFRDAVEDYMDLTDTPEDGEDFSIGASENSGECCNGAASFGDSCCDQNKAASSLAHCSSAKMFKPFIETTVEFASIDGVKHATQSQASQVNLAHNLAEGLQSAVNFHFQTDTDLTRQGSDIAQLLSEVVRDVPDGQLACKFLTTLSHVLDEAVMVYIAETEK